MEKRVTELEVRLSLAEDQIEALNRTAFRQQEQLDLLQEQLRLLYRRMQAQPPAESQGPREDIPPHY
jgi:SlyX protein